MARMMTDVIDAFMDRLFIAVPPLREEWERYLQTQQNHEAAIPRSTN
jgi:hypothetical protein